MADASPQISVAELRAALVLLLDSVERRFGASLQLGVDAYEGLFAPAMFGADGASPEVMGRSLADDVESVRELVHRDDRDDDENLLWHDLDHLVGVLQRISALAS